MTRITQQNLESYLWGAAVLLRGTIDAGDYKQFIFPLLFYKRLCDVFDEETVTALRDSGGDEDFALFPENHRFQVPADAHWREIRKVNRDVGSALQQAMRAIETANPDKLFGIFGDAQWTNKDRLSDAMLRDLIEHFSSLELTVANLPEDELGQGYEYLIKKFADDSGHTAAEFYTNRTVVHLMTEMLDVQPGESVYDPTCGSGGMLLSCIAHLRNQKKEWRNVKLYGQERNLMTSSIARMNCFLHGIEDFHIERGDTLAEPKLVEGDRLQRFDVVLANPPYSIKQWNRDAFAADPWGRNVFGVPPQGRADYAFQQHILQSLKPKTGRCAVLWPHGVLFRQEEDEIRRKLIESDLIECVVGLGPNLFYNSAMDSCIVICRTEKSKVRRGKILLIGAKNEVSRERTQSFLSRDQIARIVHSYEQFKSEAGFSSTATIEDIRSRGYNLNIALYITNVASRTSPNAESLDAPNGAFRTLLKSSAQLHESMATILNSSAKPSVDSDRLRLSLPTWLDRSKWRKVKLGDIVRQIRDKVDDAGRAGISHYLPGGGISATSFRIKEWKAVGDGLMGPAFHMRFKPHHVLYKSRVPHGVGVSDRVGICANTTYVLEAIAEVLDQRLLPFLLVTEAFRQFERDNNRGSTNLFLNYSDIAKFEFALPPLDQQRRIAEILWAVDEVEERQMALCGEVKNARDQWFGRVLQGALAETIKIADLGQIITGTTPKTSEPKNYEPSERLFVSPADIGLPRCVTTTVKRISEVGLMTGRPIPRDGVMVVCIGSTIGKVAMAGEQCLTNQQINTVVCGEQRNPLVAYYALLRQQPVFRQIASCTAVPILNKGHFASIEIPYPKRQAEADVADRLMEFEEAEIKSTDAVENSRTLKTQLINTIL